MSSTDSLLANEYFQVKYHGEIALVIPSPEVEQLPESLMQPAASMLLAPLKEEPPSHVVVDLTGVRYFGSAFITFLLRLHLMGCFAVQGFGLGQPVAAALLPALVQAIEARIPGVLDRSTQAKAVLGH